MFRSWPVTAVVAAVTAGPPAVAAWPPAVGVAPGPRAASATSAASASYVPPAGQVVPPSGDYPSALTLRYASQGWVGFVQAGAAVLTCAAPGSGPGCADATTPAAWVDVDADVSTVNSNTAFVKLPPGASIDWAGLSWAGDRGGDATGPGCAAVRDAGGPAVLPPDPGHANQVRVAVNASGYVGVSAGSFTDVTAPNGGHGFQAQADITGLVRPLASPTRAVRVSVTVADLQVAQGAGCVGGWAMTVAYSYPDGPNRTFAPQYRSLAIADGAIALPAGTVHQVRVDGLASPTDGSADAQVGLALLASDPAAGARITVGAKPLVAKSGAGGGGPGAAGYQVWTANLPPGAIQNTSVTFGVTPTQDAFVAAVVALTARLSVRVDLAVTTAVAPAAVPIGDDATVTVTVRNDSPVPASGVQVTARLPAGLVLATPTPGYDARTGVWWVGSVPAHGSRAMTLRVRVERAGVLVGTAEVSAADLPDVDSTPGDRATNQDDLAVLRLSGQAPQSLPVPSPAAAAAVSTPDARAGGPWPPIQSSLLIGTGLFLLGLLMALIIVLRRQVDT